MTTSTNGSEIIDVVGQRIDFVEAVRDVPKDKRTLVEETAFSRSTVDRAVRELEALELLRYSDGRYDSTPVGEFAADAYRQFTDTIDVVCRLKPFLRWVSPADFDLDLRWLADADLFTPEPGDPYAMINRHVRLVEQADTGQYLLPVVGKHAAEVGCDSITEDGSEVGLIVTPAAAETLQTDSAYTDLIDRIAALDRFRLYVYDGTIPLTIAIFDRETVQFGVDDGGEPRCLVETDNEKACTWAMEEFERYREQSKRLL